MVLFLAFTIFVRYKVSVLKDIIESIGWKSNKIDLNSVNAIESIGID